MVFDNCILNPFDESKYVNVYADDITIACARRDKEAVEHRLQREVDKVIELSEEERLIINAAKS